jgi:hypothetical protein
MKMGLIDDKHIKFKVLDEKNSEKVKRNGYLYMREKNKMEKQKQNLRGSKYVV